MNYQKFQKILASTTDLNTNCLALNTIKPSNTNYIMQHCKIPSSKPPAKQQLVFSLVTQTDIKDGSKQEHKAEI